MQHSMRGLGKLSSRNACRPTTVRAGRLLVHNRTANGASGSTGEPGPGGFRASSTWNPPSSSSQPPLTPEEVNAKAAQLSELIQETVRVTMSTGPKGFARALQAAQSVAQLGQEYLLKGKLDPAPVLMRKLFEKLGATYIKLVSAAWGHWVLGCLASGRGETSTRVRIKTAGKEEDWRTGLAARLRYRTCSQAAFADSTCTYSKGVAGAHAASAFVARVCDQLWTCDQTNQLCLSGVHESLKPRPLHTVPTLQVANASFTIAGDWEGAKGTRVVC